jgi:Tol biopolymer transport system component
MSLLVGALLGAMLWSRPTGVDLGSYRFRPFATDPENEYAPAWSPDGRSIAYTRVVDDRAQIFARSLDADSAVQITDLANGAWWPFWSSDGRRVWFRSDDGVWSVGRAGGEPELVHEGRFNAGALSPDGTTLATWRWTGDENTSGSVWLASPPRGDLKRYEPAPFEVSAALGRNYLRFSPDSAWLLASIQGDEGVEIWLLPVAQGARDRAAPKRLFANVRWQNTPQISWMPDGRRVVLAFAGTEEGRRQLWMADLRTETVRPITSGITHKIHSDVSPDGSRIVFSQSEPDFDLVEVPLDGSPPRDLYASGQNEYAAAWVPGQDRFVYTAERGGQVEIRVRSRGGDWDRAIVTQEDFPDEVTRIIQAPVVSPDGEQVAYARWPERGPPSIWLSPIGGGVPTKLVDTAGSQSSPDWSPDGRWLTFVWSEGGESKLAKIRVGSTEPLQTLVETCVSGVPDWSPTGEWIAYYCNTDPDRGIWLVSPDGGESSLVISIDRGDLVWSRDGSLIYAVRDDQLVAVDVQSGEEAVIWEFGPHVTVYAPYGPNRPLSLASDAKGLSVSVYRVHMDLWLLDGFDQRAGWWDRFR